MTDDRNDDDGAPGDDEVARAREMILKRRSRMMTAAMASLGMIGTSCSKSSVCLSIANPDPDSGVNTNPDAGHPRVCLDVQPEDAGLFDAGPSVCLEPVFDGAPSVCLEIWVPPDAGADGGDRSAPEAGPSVCLTPPLALEDSNEPDPPVEG